MKNDYIEFEAKFYPVDKEKYRKKLLSIGAKLVISERKMIRIVADDRKVLIRGIVKTPRELTKILK